LRLYLLVVSDNLSYQLKFQDIASQSNSVAYFLESKTTVNPNKFFDYWFLDYEKIMSKVLGN